MFDLKQWKDNNIDSSFLCPTVLYRMIVVVKLVNELRTILYVLKKCYNEITFALDNQSGRTCM